MRRGTTPTIELGIAPYTAEDFDVMWVTFAQGTSDDLRMIQSGGTLPPEVFTKYKGDEGVTLEGQTVTIKFTQEDTLKFNVYGKPLVFAQIRCLLTDGDADASNIVSFPVGAILKGGVIA